MDAASRSMHTGDSCMDTRETATALIRPLLAVLLIIGAGAATADEPPSAPSAATPSAAAAPSKEMRATMAAAHERMAECLRSDRAVADCRSEMQATCRSMMGGQGQGCPMAGGQGCPMQGQGMRKRAMQTPSASDPSPR